MIHHYITQYKENGKQYAIAWIQINLFGKCFCFSKRKIRIHEIREVNSVDELASKLSQKIKLMQTAGQRDNEVDTN